jgi:hypothetical protein
MLAPVCSAAVNGREAFPVEAEVNAGWGETIMVIFGFEDWAGRQRRQSGNADTDPRGDGCRPGCVWFAGVVISAKRKLSPGVFLHPLRLLVCVRMKRSVRGDHASRGVLGLARRVHSNPSPSRSLPPSRACRRMASRRFSSNRRRFALFPVCARTIADRMTLQDQAEELAQKEKVYYICEFTE